MKHFYTYFEFKEQYPSNSEFTPETYEEYLSVSVAFIESNLSELFGAALNIDDMLQFAFKTIKDDAIQALLEQAKHRNSSSWRKLRRSIVVAYAAIGLNSIADEISDKTNPVSVDDRVGKNGRAMRKKYVTQDEFRVLLRDRVAAGQTVTAAYIYLCYHLGLRPEEVHGLEYEVIYDKIRITVPHVKKTEAGKADPAVQRGIDRELIVPMSYTMLEYLDIAINSCDGSEKDRVRMQINRAVNRLFPEHKQRISLYSLRYTMGADLKRQSDHNAVAVASVLGHRNPDSSAVYGNARSSSGRRVVPAASLESQAQVNPDPVEELEKLRLKMRRELGPALSDILDV